MEVMNFFSKKSDKHVRMRIKNEEKLVDKRVLRDKRLCVTMCGEKDLK